MRRLIRILLVLVLAIAALTACTQQANIGKEGTDQTGTDQSVTDQTGTEPGITVTNDSEAPIEESNADLTGNSTVDSGDMIEASAAADYEKVMTETKMSPADMMVYIRENGEKLSGEQAANLMLKLEQLQIDGLLSMTERYFDTDQSELLADKAYDFETGEIHIDSIKNESLREVLADALRNGYKTETAEGSFFPVIDYSIYENFSSMLPDDLNSYFSLMAVESENKPASDGGLVIGWSEVLERAIAQEQFILKYAQSQKLNEVKELYRKYINFIFDGSSLPNAKHFTYDTKTLEPRLKESLVKASAKNGDSPLEKTISEYMEVLKKNNYKLTAEVKQFRENAAVALSK
jgi:hypothetical protein